MKNDSGISDAIRDSLISHEYSNPGGDPVNLTEVLAKIGNALWSIDESISHPLAGVNGATKIKEGCESIASAINNLADAIRDTQQEPVPHDC